MENCNNKKNRSPCGSSLPVSPGWQWHPSQSASHFRLPAWLFPPEGPFIWFIWGAPNTKTVRRRFFSRTLAFQRLPTTNATQIGFESLHHPDKPLKRARNLCVRLVDLGPYPFFLSMKRRSSYVVFYCNQLLENTSSPPQHRTSHAHLAAFAFSLFAHHS